MFSFNTPATRALPHLPFPDISKVYGRGYSNVRDSISAYKPPVLSTKTQDQLNKEIASNIARHRIKWSESEVKRAIKTGWHGEEGEGESESADSGSESGGEGGGEGGEGVGESKEGEGGSGDDSDDSDYEEEEEKGTSAPPRGLVPETADEKANPVVEAYEKFVAAGLSRLAVPKDKEGLKRFMKHLRDSNIVRVKYSGTTTPEANRKRLLEKFGITEETPTFLESDGRGGVSVDGAMYKHVGKGRFEIVERSKLRD